MGFAKRELERRDEMTEAARTVALEMDALERCTVHEDEIIDPLAGMNDEVADELIARFHAKADETSVFTTEAEIREAVANAFNEAGEECGSCAKHRDE